MSRAARTGGARTARTAEYGVVGGGLPIVMTSLAFGPFGITTGLTSAPQSLEAAAAAEELGYPAIWLSGGPLPGLQTITDLIEATRTIKFVTGILSVDSYPAQDVAAAYQSLEATHPGRFTVGLGGAHGPNPLTRLNEYFDQLDAGPDELQPNAVPIEPGPDGAPVEPGPDAVPAEPRLHGVPVEHRVLSALGPRMLELARRPDVRAPTRSSSRRPTPRRPARSSDRTSC